MNEFDPYEATCPGDSRPRTAIEVSRRFAVGDASRAELGAAWDAARAAADAADAAGDAAGADKLEKALREVGRWIEAWDETFSPPLTDAEMQEYGRALTLAGLNPTRYNGELIRRILADFAPIVAEALGDAPQSDYVVVPSDTLDWIFRSLCAYLDYFGADSRCYDPKEAVEAIRSYTRIGNADRFGEAP